MDPTPCLHLFVAKIALRDNYRLRAGAEKINLELARLSFRYGDITVEASDARSLLTRIDGEEVTCVQRNINAETAAQQTLTNWDFVPLHRVPAYDADDTHSHDYTLFGDNCEEALLDFSTQGMRALKAAGWIVTMADDYPYRVVESEPNWYAHVTDAPKRNWFDIELGVSVEGQRVSLVPILINLLRTSPMPLLAMTQHPETEEKHIVVRLPDGRLLPVPTARVKPILAVLMELYREQPRDSKTLRLPAVNAAQLADLEAAGGDRVQWRGGENLRRLGRKLRDFSGMTNVTPPDNLHAKLRNYQLQGLTWLQFLREYHLGGILADDMGLGKTVQTLAHLLLEKQTARTDLPSLVIAPTSLVINWQLETERFAPSLRTLVLHGSDRKQHFDNLADYDLVVTTYGLIPRDYEQLLGQAYHLLILDEAQTIKNPKAKISRLVRKLNARHRLCLTGTPMENHLGELWALFDFLTPGLLGSETAFRRLFRAPIEKDGDEERRLSLSRRIAPFLLRRTKQDVATELPPKTEMIRKVDLGESQRELYESIRLAVHASVQREIDKKGMGRCQVIILDALLKLRQVCCDPRLVKLDAAKRVKHSAKLAMLMEMLPELVEEGRRILLFSQFTSMLSLIEAELVKTKLAFVKLTGQTKNRAKAVQRFQNGEVPIFLISLKAGGTGLNLTAADTVIHYDPWWNPATENQASDRAYRIGQDKPVFVYKLLTSGTVEEKIQHLQTSKQQLAASLFNSANEKSLSLTSDDLNALLEPLEYTRSV